MPRVLVVIGLGMTLPIAAGTSPADAAPITITAKSHEGQRSPSLSYTSGNVTTYAEGDTINFRFTLTGDAGSSGQVSVRFTENDGSCLFFDGSFVLGSIDNVSGQSPVVTAVGTPTVDAEEWVQPLNVTFSAEGVAVVNYTLKLSNDAGGCTGSSQHSRLSPTGGDVSQTGAQNVPVPANQVLILPTITAVKHIDRDGNGTFESTAKAGEYCFALDGDSCIETDASGQVVFPNVSPDGTHSVTETQLDTSLGTYAFASGSGTNCTFDGSTAYADVAAGRPPQDATCNFNNSLTTGTLRVIKEVINDDGGTAVAGDFTLHVKASGTDVGGSPASGSATGTDYTLPGGVYTISEDTPPSGYVQTGISGDCDANGSVTLTPGVNKTCTITNDDVAPKLIVIKDVINDNGGTADAADFTMDVTGTNVSSASFAGAEDPGTEVTLDAGAYSVDESGGPAGYAKTLGADCSGTIAVGETKTCTITNDDIAAKLIVIKEVINDNGGSAVAGDFTMDVTGTNVSSASFPGAEDPGTEVGLDAGAYSVDESGGPAGYAKSLSADCSGTIAVGETKTCTITNSDIGPRLIVIKHVINDDGGAADAGDFTMEVTGSSASPASFPGAEDPGTEVALNTGAYSVDESGGPSGYASSFSAECSGTIAVGEVKTCTITNDDIAPKLIVIKHVINDNGGTAVAGDFTMDVTAEPGPVAFPGVEDPGAEVIIDAGAYSVDESGGPAGYAKSLSADCSGTIAVGEVKTCTITNDDIAPKLIVIKDVINDNGGTAVAGDFTMDVTAEPGPLSFPGAEDPGTEVGLDAGAYSVDESGGPAGYAKSLSADCSGTIAVGEVKTCTITNDDIAARLVVIKEVINDNGGTAVAGDFTMDVTAEPGPLSFPGAEDPGTEVTIDAGAYSVDESGGPAGYAKSLSADCSGTIAVGQTKTCTITNDDIAPKLIVIKHVINDNGGSADAGDFTMDVSAEPGPLSFPGVEDPGTEVTIDAGAYSVDESGGPAGYAKSLSADCSGTIAVGEVKTCTITNDDIIAKLIVIKDVINDNGGTAVAGDFTMDVTGTNVASPSFPGAADPGTEVALDAGAYSVDESGGPAGYAKSLSADCSGAIAVGQTKTCTITNDDIAPKLIVIKHVINDNGGSADAGDFTMDVSAEPGPLSFPGAEDPGTEVTIDAGAYSVDESGGPAGYAKSSSADCSGTIAVGETKTCTITNDDIAPKLIVIKEVINDNGGSADAGDFTMDVSAEPGPLSFPGAEDPGTEVTIDAGAYSVDESGGPVGYAKSLSADCSGTIALAEVKTCTITNDDIAPTLIVIKHVINDDDGTKVAGDFTMNVEFAAAALSFPGEESGTNLEVVPGAYTVDESDPGLNYAKTLSADCSGTIALGETKTCTITNDDQRAVLPKNEEPAPPAAPAPPVESGTLPRTGAETMALVGLGGFLLLLGMVVVASGRRRTTS